MILNPGLFSIRIPQECVEKNLFYFDIAYGIRMFLGLNISGDRFTKVFTSCISRNMAAFYTFVNRVLNICSGPISFNNEIQYLNRTALDRGYNPLISDKSVFKLQNPRLSHPFHSNSNINIRIPFFSKSQFFHC